MLKRAPSRFLALSVAVGCVGLTLISQAVAVPSSGEAQSPSPPQVAEASNEGELAIQRIVVPQGLKVELVAAEPLVANPVALWIDDQGRISVCETFRQVQAVTDNRKHSQAWVDDDLAARTVADREAYHRKHLGDKIKALTEVDDRIRRLDDTDGDGRVDRALVFADGFNGIVDGTGAGVLTRGRDVFYTNIPHLWHLRDTNGDGKADERASLASGFGVKVAYRGHDMHGLTIGPDGRLYWSIGDRGYHVELPDGRVLSDPESGAVFRCELDGSAMEVFATGLRNPQELAFDEYGNLFTGDNNSDSGDKARWVYVVRGGDSGWRMHYQYLGDRGPFNREKIWYPNDPETPAYVVPPIINFADGPSGLTYYPGTGLPEQYRGTFFLCDFRGGAATSGVRALKVNPKGAGFEAVDEGEFVWKILATDCDFGPDGGLYVTDWVNGWDGLGKGRIYKVFDPKLAASPAVIEVKRLLAEGMTERSSSELAALLRHVDRRIRQEAQFELVHRRAVAELIHAATKGDSIFERLAGTWGLGQIARRNEANSNDTAVAALVPLLDDAEPEVRGQAARQLADALSKDTDAAAKIVASKVISLLDDRSPRVRFFAAEALSTLADPSAFDPLVKMLAENADQDRHLRHAGILGLAGVADTKRLGSLAMHGSASVRIAAVVALRRLKSPDVANFLRDQDERIVLEAARAIHDVPIKPALPRLAELWKSGTTNDALLRRIANVNNRLGDARAVAAIAARTDVPEVVRRIALRYLQNWPKPTPRDQVHSGWWPIEARDAAPAADALGPVLAAILDVPGLREPAARAATALGMPEADKALLDLFADRGQPGDARASALATLSRIGHPTAGDLIEKALHDATPAVRATARDLIARKDLKRAMPMLVEAIASGDPREGQAAIDTLASLQKSESDAMLASLMEKLLSDDLRAELHLELVEAARRAKAREIKTALGKYQSKRSKKDPAAEFRECMTGGDAERGRQIFFEKAEASCVRCHRVGTVGSEVGPKLDAIGTKARDYVLEAIVDPNRAIAEGFDTIVVITDDGQSISGIIKAQDETTITLLNADGKTIVVKKDSIDEQVPGRSSMPADLMKQLTPRELRDLVEYLSTLKG